MTTASLEHTLVYSIMEQGAMPGLAERSRWCFEHLEPDFFENPDCRHYFVLMRQLCREGSMWGHTFAHMRDLAQSSKREADDRMQRLFSNTDEEACFAELTIPAAVQSLVKSRERRDIGEQMEIAAHSHDPLAEAREIALIEPKRPFEKEPSPVEEFLDDLRRISMPDHGFKTGLQPLDTSIRGGLQPGELVIVGARPGTGKTALLTNFARKALNNQEKWGYVTLEMGSSSVFGRIASGVVGKDFLGGLTTDEQNVATEFIRYAEEQRKARMFRIDTSPDTVEAIAQWARRFGPFRVIFVDYLQLLTDREVRRHGKTQEVTEISRGLKRLAMQLETPIVAACQLNRLAEQRNDRQPRISDLRESGSIEQDADIVLLLHDPYRVWNDGEKKGEQPPVDLLQLKVAKNRRGDTPTLKLRYDKGSQRIEPWEYQL